MCSISPEARTTSGSRTGKPGTGRGKSGFGLRSSRGARVSSVPAGAASRQTRRIIPGVRCTRTMISISTSTSANRTGIPAITSSIRDTSGARIVIKGGSSQDPNGAGIVERQRNARPWCTARSTGTARGTSLTGLHIGDATQRRSTIPGLGNGSRLEGHDHFNKRTPATPTPSFPVKIEKIRLNPQKF